MNSSNYAVTLDNVHAVYGRGKTASEALHGITANIPAGGITGLMGPDASGKTTLMRILAGLMRPSAGEISIFGKPLAQIGANESGSIGYMPQRFGLYEDLTVIENLNLYAAIAGVSGQRREELYQTLLQFTSLGPFLNRLAGRLSGGMKQKLGIACVLLATPKLLLLDEPGVGVDPQSRRELWAMVKQLASSGMTIIWSTSYLDEGAACPRLIMIEAGKTLFSGAPAQISATMDGYVYLLEGKPDASGLEHRQALAEWSVQPGIIDAVIQGRSLRLTLGREQDAEARRKILAAGGKPAPAGLEDAYMEAVGGMDKRPSPYVSIRKINSGKQPVIVADRLTRKFGDFTAAADITFHVSPGEIYGLLGPNGAGKSTTFRMLCGLLQPSSGKCSVDGVDMINSGSQARQRIGYMAQNFSLYPDISVRQNIAIFADLYNVGKESRKTLLPMLIAALGMNDYLKSKTGSLPRGLKQRLALLCATMHEPTALFLDEPTSGVDVQARRDFWKHISALTAKGVAVLVTTHFMEEAEYCDRIALLYRGAMINQGSPDDLKALVRNIPNPTLEDAFIACIQAYDRTHPL